MRDAFGGAFSIKLMLIFLVLYVSFMCVALSYARAFRVKNRIINIIEQNEGYTAQAAEDIEKYLSKAGYNISQQDVGDKICSGCTFYQPGYSVMEVNSTETNGPKYYKVETYLVFNVLIVSFPISIEGETRRIETLN